MRFNRGSNLQIAERVRLESAALEIASVFVDIVVGTAVVHLLLLAWIHSTRGDVITFPEKPFMPRPRAIYIFEKNTSSL